MKFAIITNYWKHDGGGIMTYLVNLTDALRTKGADVSVIYRSGNDPENFKTAGNKVLFIFQVYFQLRKIRPDIIQIQFGHYGLIPSVIYKKLHGCVLIYTFHTYPEKRMPSVMKKLYQYLLSNCDSVTFVSKNLLERVMEVDNFSLRNTVISYGGAPYRPVSEAEVSQFMDQFGIKKDALVLLAQAMTTNLLKIEGLKLLFKAVIILRDKHPDIQLIVTREGPYITTIKAVANEMGLKDHVIFTGELTNPFVPLKLCDVYTHITLGDGLPMSLLEAMAMSKPIIATPIGGIPEAIEDGVNGILIRPDPALIAQTIDLLLRDREYAGRLGANAKKTADEKFSWAKAATTFLSLYPKKGNNKVIK